MLGIIWALWHLPLFFIPGTGSDGQSFPIYLLHVTALSVAMAWLYWKTDGSLLLVMLMHASVNNTTDIIPAAVPGATDPFSFAGSTMAVYTIALSWLLAVAAHEPDARRAACGRRADMRMTQPMVKVAIVVVVASVFLLLMLSAAWGLQRGVMFPAPPARPLSGNRGVEPVVIDRASGGYQALLLPPHDAAQTRSPVVIFAHGNGELADDWIDEFEPMRDWGWAVLLLEYPGYGGSPGTPSESSIRDAALAVFDWAAADPRVDATRMVALRPLHRWRAAASRLPRPGRSRPSSSSPRSPAPVRWRRDMASPAGWCATLFDNLEALGGYRGPLLVIHGSDDRLIPISEGQALAAAVPSAEFHALPCGHNDCPRPWGLIRAFLESHRLLPAAPRLRLEAG